MIKLRECPLIGKISSLVIWILLLGLTIGTVNAMKKDSTVIKNYEDFLEDAEKLIGKKLKPTTGGSSKNHQVSEENPGALDIGVNTNNLSKEEYNKVGDLALRYGYRLGDEDNHLHVDNRPDNPTRVFLGKKDGFKGAPDNNRFIKALQETTRAKGSWMGGIPNKGLDMVDEEKNLEEELKKESSDMHSRLRVNRKPKSVSEATEQFASEAIETSPIGNQLSVHQKRKLQTEVLNPDNITEEAAKAQEQKAQGQTPSVKNNFMEAIAYFLPSIAGLAVGGIIGGNEGAAQGAQLGMQAGKNFADYGIAKQRVEQQNQLSPMDMERLQVSKGNLDLRKKDLIEQKKRTANLEEDRQIRREERDLTRALSAKESFSKRPDVKKLQDQGLMLRDINNIINDAPEIASGVIGFKIAKGIAGEVGNLTENEREAAQVSPSFLRKIERQGTNFLMGRLPEEDVKDLNKVVKVLEERRKSQLRNIVGGFTKSRAKSFSKDIAEEFQTDLFNEYGLIDEQTKKPSGKITEQDIDNMSIEELKAAGLL